MHKIGFDQVRVRHHGLTARIEVPQKGIPRCAQLHQRIYRYMLKLGYRFVTLDLGGYITGNMNRGVGVKER